MSAVVKPSIAVAAVVCALLAGIARAEEGRGGSDVAPMNGATNPLRGKVVDQGALAQQRGGSDAASQGDLKLNGTVTGNNASNLTTGSNIIADGALAGASGVPMVIQNSGNNVLIQSATIINVTVK